MTTQLIVYNLALLNLGERRLASLTEPREPRRVLDDLWPIVSGYCLAQGMWAFALRDSDALAQVAGAAGYEHGYTKPADMIHLQVMADVIQLYPQIDRDFLDLGATIYTHTATLFCRYSSNDVTSGGMNLAVWTDNFTYYVAAALARFACVRVTGSSERYNQLCELEDDLYLTAYQLDSVHMMQGQLPFNAEARNKLGSEALTMGDALLPFAAYRRAMSRRAGPGTGPQAQS